MSAGPYHVLLVDDHEESLEVLAMLLRRAQYEVETARSFQEATAAASRRRFDLLIADLGLPDRSGLELVQELRPTGGVKAIALSGFTDDRDVTASRAAGYACHLNKPVMFKDLLQAIHKVMDWPPLPLAPATPDTAWQAR